MTYDIDLESNTAISKSEILWLGAFFSLVTLLTLIDVIEDWHENIPLRHIIPEIFIAMFCITSVGYIFKRFADSRKRSITQIRAELVTAKKSAHEWQTKAETLKQGISQAITEQLEKWGLSKAEQEVTFLLIKGLSTKEIAEVRETTEGTIRLQCSVIYKKSGLQGRAQLAAFFMEDLLI